MAFNERINEGGLSFPDRVLSIKKGMSAASVTAQDYIAENFAWSVGSSRNTVPNERGVPNKALTTVDMATGTATLQDPGNDSGWPYVGNHFDSEYIDGSTLVTCIIDSINPNETQNAPTTASITFHKAVSSTVVITDSDGVETTLTGVLTG